MNPAHLHLLLNHVAILGSLFSLLIFISGRLMSENVLVRTALIGFVFSALISIPVFLTGEPAEELVEDLPGITHEIIHSHEEAAEFSIWMIEILGLISLLSFFTADRFKRFLNLLILLFGFISVVSLVYTGMEGGKIRHSEIRSDAPYTPLMNEEEHHKDK